MLPCLYHQLKMSYLLVIVLLMPFRTWIFLSSDIQALFDNDFELEDIALPVISHNHDNSRMVPTNTSINSQVRNVNGVHYSAGPNVLNTYQNNMATFPQNLMPNISKNNCTVNFHFFLFKMRKNTLA